MANLHSFYVSRYLTNGAVFSWDAEDALIESYRLYSGDSNTGPWVLAFSDSGGALQSTVITTGDVFATSTWFKLEALCKDGTTEQIVIQAPLFGASGSQPTPMAIDETGVPRMLKVDSGGNLVVTGIAIGSAGTGDASAALQNQQISQGTVLAGKVDDVNINLIDIETGLNDVHLNTNQITQLKTVSVDNYPSDYPNVAGTAKLTSIDSKVATETTLAIASSKLNPLLKTSDLAFTLAGDLSTHVSNFPTDFRDDSANLRLEDIKTYTGIANAWLESVDTRILGIASTALPALKLDTAGILAGVQAANSVTQNDLLPLVDQGFVTVTSGLGACAQDITLQAVSSKLDLLVRSTDLPKTLAGNISAEVANFPAEYPSSATVNALNSILTELERLDTANVAITSPLPSGSNALGSVSVTALPLPADASKESTQLNVKGKLDSLYAELISVATGSVKDRLNRLETKLTSILSELQTTDSVQDLYSSTHTILSSGQATSTPINTVEYSTIGLNIQCISVSTGLKLTVKGSLNGIDFSTLQGMSNISLNGQSMYTLTLTSLLPYIQVTIFNSALTSAAVSILVRGKK